MVFHDTIVRSGISSNTLHALSKLSDVSQWCNPVDLLGKRRKITLSSCFEEIRITYKNDIMLIYVPHGQESINF
ncbi:hypothetical protein I3760_06G007300 [Carya illinoinensis]|nr:hypothetical protein I3760_06G007300 [Carya illinoinensis]